MVEARTFFEVATLNGGGYQVFSIDETTISGGRAIAVAASDTFESLFEAERFAAALRASANRPTEATK